MREGTIDEVGLDADQRVFVRPSSGDFEYVYRAAMEVYWDRSSRRLSHPQAPRGWTPVRWFQQIVAAVADEYGVQLSLTKQTTWTAVPEDTRLAIEAAGQSKSG